MLHFNLIIITFPHVLSLLDVHVYIALQILNNLNNIPIKVLILSLFPFDLSFHFLITVTMMHQFLMEGYYY